MTQSSAHRAFSLNNETRQRHPPGRARVMSGGVTRFAIPFNRTPC